MILTLNHGMSRNMISFEKLQELVDFVTWPSEDLKKSYKKLVSSLENDWDTAGIIESSEVEDATREFRDVLLDTNTEAEIETIASEDEEEEEEEIPTVVVEEDEDEDEEESTEDEDAEEDPA